MKNNQIKWKEGDWCFHRFKLSEIRKMSGDLVTEVSDGYFSTGGGDLREDIQPMTMGVKTISEFFRDQYDTLHKKGNCGLNFPEIMDWLVSRWTECCKISLVGKDNESKKAECKSKIKERMEKVENFCDEILRVTEEMKVMGVRVFRPVLVERH